MTWIYDRMPDSSDEMLVTVLSKSLKIVRVCIGRKCPLGDAWLVDGYVGFVQSSRIIAWAELPEPAKP